MKNSFDQLKIAIENSTKTITEQQLQNVVDAFQNRMTVVIVKEGGFSSICITNV